MDLEPVFIWVLLNQETDKTHIQDNTLLWDSLFDPMLYFWPVENQHVVCSFDVQPDVAQSKRLVKALLRDGAIWVTVMWHQKNDSRFTGYDLKLSNYGDPDRFMRERYAVDVVAVSGGSGAENPGGSYSVP